MIDLAQFKAGDIVRCEFAPPAKGWIEAEVADVMDDYIRLYIQNGWPYDIKYSLFTSITKVEPPIKAGDVVWTGGKAWLITHTSTCRDLRARNCHGTDRQIEFIPDDAIWLVRSGEVNPLLAGE